MTRRGDPGPWYGNDHKRVLFERSVRGVFPDLAVKVDRGGRSGHVHYRLAVPVPHYGARLVHARVANLTDPALAGVFVEDDGPVSPHRYGDGSLCMWFPEDPRAEKWVASDGLLALLGFIERHLFREAYFDESGEWLGPEVDHEGKPHQ